MSELIIIAGPQAAGKSTSIAHLDQQFRSAIALCGKRRMPVLMPLQESRQIEVHMKMLLGAIFMTTDDEEEIVECDFRRMDLILERNNKRVIYVDECNVFTTAHAEAHGVKKIQRHRQQYFKYLEKLKAKVIFIDVPPETSWERRHEKYEQRLIYFPRGKHQSMMKRYRVYLEDVYPRLHSVYDQLPVPKTMLDGRVSQKAVAESVTRELTKMSSFF